MENISGLPFHPIVSIEIIILPLFSYLVFQIFFAISSLRNCILKKTFLEWYLYDCRNLFPQYKTLEVMPESGVMSATWGQDEGKTSEALGVPLWSQE